MTLKLWIDHGHRPVNHWGDGDLPAPFAEGDVVDVPDGSVALERMHGMPPGRYLICTAFSVDEGDGWYFRVTPDRRMRKGEQRNVSDRLHIFYSGRCDYDEGEDVNYLADCTLVETADPDGFAERERLLADGWALTRPADCPVCHSVLSA